MKKCASLITMLTLLTCVSCDILDEVVNISESASGTVYYWISTDADTYVECVNVVGPCTGSQANHSENTGLVVAHNPFSIKRTYVNFPSPVFPEGTVIEEAYFEMFHSGKNEDGKTDNINLSVTRVREAWQAGELTYDNQPVRTGSTGEYNLKLESQDWSGTPDISFDIENALFNAMDFNGFVVFYPFHEPGYEKGFHSGNHNSRTIGDLGFAPRLLLKVTLPDGMTTDDVTFGAIHPDGNAGTFFGIEFRQGNNWPADWDIAIAN